MSSYSDSEGNDDLTSLGVTPTDLAEKVSASLPKPIGLGPAYGRPLSMFENGDIKSIGRFTREYIRNIGPDDIIRRACYGVLFSVINLFILGITGAPVVLSLGIFIRMWIFRGTYCNFTIRL